MKSIEGVWLAFFSMLKLKPKQLFGLKDSSIYASNLAFVLAFSLTFVAFVFPNLALSQNLPKPGLNQFSVENAYSSSFLYNLTNENNNALRTRAIDLGFSDIKIFEDPFHAAKAILLEHQDFAFLGFRGTETTPGVLVDLNFAQTKNRQPDLPGRLHLGFTQIHNQLWPNIYKALRILQQKNKALFLAGHSQGGSLAIMTAARAAYYGIHNVDSIYTFGSPRFSDEGFALSLNPSLVGKIYRIDNHLDIIPRIPPPPHAAEEFIQILPKYLQYDARLILDSVEYVHVGKLYAFDRNKKLLNRDSYKDDEDKKYWNWIYEHSKIMGPWKTLSFFEKIITYHNHLTYISQLQSLTQK